MLAAWPPPGTTLLALAIGRRVADGGDAPEFVPPASSDAREFLREVGFDRYLDGHGAARELERQSGTREMRQMAALDPAYIHQIADLLAERVPEMSETTSHLIGLCMKELLQNVFEHAPEVPGGPVLCFVHSRWYLREHNVRVAVVDDGIGIPAALRRRQVRGLQRASDLDVVEASVAEPGLSSGRGRRGLGLKLIRDIVTARDGTLTVISGTAKVKFATRSRIMRGRKLPQPFRGTAIEIDFRPGKAIPIASEPADEVF
jgi:two-component sensor histidine kinase